MAPGGRSVAMPMVSVRRRGRGGRSGAEGAQGVCSPSSSDGNAMLVSVRCSSADQVPMARMRWCVAVGTIYRARRRRKAKGDRERGASAV